MQFALNITKRQWYIRTVQSGSESGWSQWCEIPRLEALNHIERGWTFIHLD